MIDSVLKGTGNSRFLKSAVPAGTSWADALAMLQAGTFPIDFNGINAEGFQQVGTPLNKANLLKDATAAQIGLPPSTTPDGMFQALGNTGELHVWRKTVVVGSYYIGATQGNYGSICRNTGSASFGVKIQYASEITVDSQENRNLVSPSDMTIIANNSGITSPSATSVANTLKGKFIRLAGIPDGYQNSELKYAVGSVFYCPENISCFVKDAFNDGNHYICLDGIKNVPTKTENVVTYPVSTNPNAYQEGEYGKAGYTLGDVKTGTFQIGQDATTIAANRAIIKYGASVSVTDTGTASIASESELTVTSDSSQSAVDKLKGNFFRFSQLPFSSSAFSVGEFYFFPANTVFTKQSSGNWYASKYQTVTSHGKTEPEYTIEYLGKLGDKARVQVLSYVGTGTYGSSNPNMLQLPFEPKYVIVQCLKNYGLAFFAQGCTRTLSLATSSGTKDISCSWPDAKTLKWYQTKDERLQLNASGAKYVAIIIG